MLGPAQRRALCTRSVYHGAFHTVGMHRRPCVSFYARRVRRDHPPLGPCVALAATFREHVCFGWPASPGGIWALQS
eukprot:245010-Rhodomonas_salina.3